MYHSIHVKNSRYELIMVKKSVLKLALDCMEYAATIRMCQGSRILLPSTLTLVIEGKNIVSHIYGTIYPLPGQTQGSKYVSSKV